MPIADSVADGDRLLPVMGLACLVCRLYLFSWGSNSAMSASSLACAGAPSRLASEAASVAFLTDLQGTRLPVRSACRKRYLCSAQGQFLFALCYRNEEIHL